MSAASPGPDVARDDDGAITVTFGGGTQAAALAAALASLPADAWVADISTSRYSGEAGCKGQGFPDDHHCFPVTCVVLLPAEMPARADS
jgi:hypothetical protein